MLDGELSDPHLEFFVEQNPMTPDDKLWTDKYKLNYIMIPAFFSNELAKQILQTGKAVNFIRKCCQVQGWSLQLSQPFTMDSGLDVNKLTIWVNEACAKTNSELLQILF